MRRVDEQRAQRARTDVAPLGIAEGSRGGVCRGRSSRIPLTTTHALIPVAVAIAAGKTPIRWKLVFAAALAAAAPDVDALTYSLWQVAPLSIYAHRGVTHSLFFALIEGALAALFHKRLGVRPLTAAALVGAAGASHGLLDMMTDFGSPVAYLWPLSSVRLYADWRPIHGGPLELGHIISQGLPRLRYEVCQLLLPLFGVALGIRTGRFVLDRSFRTMI